MSEFEAGKTVTVISSGSYSDYGVHAVLEGGAEAAQRLVDRANASGGSYSDEFFLEELPVLDADSEHPVSNLRLQEKIMDDGTTADYTEHVDVRWFHSPDKSVSWRWSYWAGHGVLEVSGDDHERVRKVFSDRRAALIANDGPPPASGAGASR